MLECGPASYARTLGTQRIRFRDKRLSPIAAARCQLWRAAVSRGLSLYEPLLGPDISWLFAVVGDHLPKLSRLRRTSERRTTSSPYGHYGHLREPFNRNRSRGRYDALSCCPHIEYAHPGFLYYMDHEPARRCTD